MSQNDDEINRTIWAERAAEGIVDGILTAIERYPRPDQVALLREIARRALRHMPNPGDEARILARHLHVENLRQSHSFDDDPPGG